MLVLARQRDQVIVIMLPDGRKIEVMVADVRGDKVRLALQAPRDIVIHRKEVLERIEEETAARKGIGVSASNEASLARADFK